MLGLICVVQYTFAAVAMELLGRRAVGFESFPKAAMSLLQLLLNADGTTMARESLSDSHPAIAVLFVAYYAIQVLVVVNLVTAQRSYMG